MKVKAVFNLGLNDYPASPLKEGETAEVDAKTGAKMVARGHAVEVVEEIKPVPLAAKVNKPDKSSSDKEA